MKPSIEPVNINAALELIEQHELAGAKIIVHPDRHKEMMMLKKQFGDEAVEQFKKYMRGYLGQGATDNTETHLVP